MSLHFSLNVSLGNNMLLQTWEAVLTWETWETWEAVLTVNYHEMLKMGQSIFSKQNLTKCKSAVECCHVQSNFRFGLQYNNYISLN